jgi:N-carbamoylputrescine amidase
MRITVCELGNNPDDIRSDWNELARHVKHESSELVVLPEMPFYPWPFAERRFSREAWDGSVSAHDAWMGRLGELAPATVLATRPVDSGRKRFNEAFVSEGVRHRRAHTKYYLPNEVGFWEASWYDRGDGRFRLVDAAEARVGFLICTELWSMADATKYGRQGAHIIAVPRTTGKATVEKWLAGGRACSIVSGCFSASSNRVSKDGSADLGGTGWVTDPDGKVLGTTSRDKPFVTVDVDFKAAARAKKTYPRYSLFQRLDRP